MSRKIIIVAVVALVLTIAMTFAFLLRSAGPPTGNFLSSFSADERKEIVSAARRDATRQALAAIKRAEVRLALGWIINGRKQTVRDVGQQPGMSAEAPRRFVLQQIVRQHGHLVAS